MRNPASQRVALCVESRALPGAVAQLGERRVRNAKVEGSIPFRSTICFHGPQQRAPDRSSNSAHSRLPRKRGDDYSQLLHLRENRLKLPALVHYAVNRHLKLIGTEIGGHQPFGLSRSRSIRRCISEEYRA